jgi:hypothetical protein
MTGTEHDVAFDDHDLCMVALKLVGLVEPCQRLVCVALLATGKGKLLLDVSQV